MFETVGKNIKKADKIRGKQLTMMEKYEKKAQKFDDRACVQAQKKFSNSYLDLLNGNVCKNGRDYEKEELQNIMKQLNKEEIDINKVRKINQLDDLYGKNIQSSDGILDRYRKTREEI